jgi:hypothetical protein
MSPDSLDGTAVEMWRDGQRLICLKCFAVSVAYVRMRFGAEAHSFPTPNVLHISVFLIQVDALFEPFVMILLKIVMSSWNLAS